MADAPAVGTNGNKDSTATTSDDHADASKSLVTSDPLPADPAALTDAQLRAQLLLHFKHTNFKSKLQHEAIRTVLKRKMQTTLLPVRL